MGFLPIFYAAGFLFIALCGYVCFSVVAGLNALGKRVFWAVLAFGACSYVGFIVVILAIAFSPLKGLLAGGFRSVIYASAYILPGLVGSWLSVKGFNAVWLHKSQV
jgi:hypothetical protein